MPIRNHDGRIVRWFGTNTDITEQKQAEAALAAHKGELEQAVAKRTEELKRSMDQLRRTETLAVLGALARGISHDLANLLLPLEANIDSASRQDLSPELKTRIEAIRKSVAYLRDLSRRLREYMQVTQEAKQVSGGIVEEIRLERWCRETESFLRSVVPPGVTFECKLTPGLPSLKVSKAALTQAVFNLVQNAGQVITEQHVGARVELWAEAVDGKVRIVVEDDGPGMPPEVRDHVFEAFFTARRGGTGIGLSIVKGFVESCGGTVEVHSPPTPQPASPPKERGTAFVLTLPVSRQA